MTNTHPGRNAMRQKEGHFTRRMTAGQINHTPGQGKSRLRESLQVELSCWVTHSTFADALLTNQLRQRGSQQIGIVISSQSPVANASQQYQAQHTILRFLVHRHQ